MNIKEQCEWEEDTYNDPIEDNNPVSSKTCYERGLFELGGKKYCKKHYEILKEA